MKKNSGLTLSILRASLITGLIYAGQGYSQTQQQLESEQASLQQEKKDVRDEILSTQNQIREFEKDIVGLNKEASKIQARADEINNNLNYWRNNISLVPYPNPPYPIGLFFLWECDGLRDPEILADPLYSYASAQPYTIEKSAYCHLLAKKEVNNKKLAEQAVEKVKLQQRLNDLRDIEQDLLARQRVLSERDAELEKEKDNKLLLEKERESMQELINVANQNNDFEIDVSKVDQLNDNAEVLLDAMSNPYCFVKKSTPVSPFKSMRLKNRILRNGIAYIPKDEGYQVGKYILEPLGILGIPDVFSKYIFKIESSHAALADDLRWGPELKGVKPRRYRHIEPLGNAYAIASKGKNTFYNVIDGEDQSIERSPVLNIPFETSGKMPLYLPIEQIVGKKNRAAFIKNAFTEGAEEYVKLTSMGTLNWKKRNRHVWRLRNHSANDKELTLKAYGGNETKKVGVPSGFDAFVPVKSLDATFVLLEDGQQIGVKAPNSAEFSYNSIGTYSNLISLEKQLRKRSIATINCSVSKGSISNSGIRLTSMGKTRKRSIWRVQNSNPDPKELELVAYGSGLPIKFIAPPLSTVFLSSKVYKDAATHILKENGKNIATKAANPADFSYDAETKPQYWLNDLVEKNRVSFSKITQQNESLTQNSIKASFEGQSSKKKRYVWKVQNHSPNQKYIVLKDNKKKEFFYLDGWTEAFVSSKQLGRRGPVEVYSDGIKEFTLEPNDVVFTDYRLIEEE